MGSEYRLPPDGLSPVIDFGQDLGICRHKDGKSVIVYALDYKPENDPDYEDPEDSIHAWQNREDAVEQLKWFKEIYEIIGRSDPKTHAHVQSLVEIQEPNGFVVLEEVPKGNLYDFIKKTPHPKIPFGKGSENPLAIKLRWALQIASALSFLHKKEVMFLHLSPSSVCLRDNLSAVLTDLSGATFHENLGSSSAAIAYDAPGRANSAWADDPDTWVKPWQDIFAFGSLLYFFMQERDPDYVCGGALPSLEEVEGKEIIEKCWQKGYADIEEVLRDLRAWIVREGLDMTGEDDIDVDESISTLKGIDEFEHGTEAT